MKPIKTLFSMVVVCFVAFSSCKKDSGSNPLTSTSFTLKVDGAAKNALTVVAMYDKNTQGLLVTGSLSPTEAVNISLQNVKTGTFDVVNDNVMATYSTSASLADTYIADSGTVTITSFTSNTVSGTFSFSASNTASVKKNVTEGKFTAKYVSQ